MKERREREGEERRNSKYTAALETSTVTLSYMYVMEHGGKGSSALETLNCTVYM